jgi:hypothetical protein
MLTEKGRSYKKQSTGTVKSLPNSAIPVTSQHHTVQERTCDYNQTQHNKSRQKISTFEEHIETLDPWEMKLL